MHWRLRCSVFVAGVLGSHTRHVNFVLGLYQRIKLAIEDAHRYMSPLHQKPVSALSTANVQAHQVVGRAPRQTARTQQSLQGLSLTWLMLCFDNAGIKHQRPSIDIQRCAAPFTRLSDKQPCAVQWRSARRLWCSLSLCCCRCCLRLAP